MASVGGFKFSPAALQQIQQAMMQAQTGALAEALQMASKMAGGDSFQAGGAGSAYGAMSPQAMQSFSARGLAKIGNDAKKAARQGFGATGLAGVLLSEGVNTRGEVKCFKRRMLSDKAFRKNVE